MSFITKWADTPQENHLMTARQAIVRGVMCCYVNKFLHVPEHKGTFHH